MLVRVSCSERGRIEPPYSGLVANYSQALFLRTSWRYEPAPTCVQQRNSCTTQHLSSIRTDVSDSLYTEIRPPARVTLQQHWHVNAPTGCGADPKNQSVQHAQPQVSTLRDSVNTRERAALCAAHDLAAASHSAKSCPFQRIVVRLRDPQSSRRQQLDDSNVCNSHHSHISSTARTPSRRVQLCVAFNAAGLDVELSVGPSIGLSVELRDSEVMGSDCARAQAGRTTVSIRSGHPTRSCARRRWLRDATRSLAARRCSLPRRRKPDGTPTESRQLPRLASISKTVPPDWHRLDRHRADGPGTLDLHSSRRDLRTCSPAPRIGQDMFDTSIFATSNPRANQKEE